jgi:hypothetical protein
MALASLTMGAQQWLAVHRRAIWRFAHRGVPLSSQCCRGPVHRGGEIAEYRPDQTGVLLSAIVLRSRRRPQRFVPHRPV